MAGIIILIVLLIIIAVMVLSWIKIVPQGNAYVVERLGKYYATWQAGLHVLVPVIDRVVNRVSLKETVLDFEPQPVITKDNVTMHIDTVVYAKVFDPALYTYGVNNPVNALENLTTTTLRSIIGDMELDETLTSREVINSKMRAVVDTATDPWGLSTTRVEIKSLQLHHDLQESMERQMKAERERREAVTRAEGEKRAAILTAEGEKQAMVLRAEAERDAKIAKAQGEAEALLKIYEAQARGIALINDAKPSKEYLTLQSYDALAKVADGKATKIIVPSELQNVAGTLSALSESVKQ